LLVTITVIHADTVAESESVDAVAYRFRSVADLGARSSIGDFRFRDRSLVLGEMIIQ
jgi:hypothetical protein